MMHSISHWGQFDIPAAPKDNLKSLAHPEWPYECTPHAWPMPVPKPYQPMTVNVYHQKLDFGIE